MSTISNSNPLQPRIQYEINNYSGGGPLPSLAAATIGGTITQMSAPAVICGVLPAMNKMGKLKQDEIAAIKEAAKKTLTDSNLISKGVNIEWLKPHTKKQSTLDILKADLISPLDAVKNGRNAFFIPKGGMLPTLDGFVKIPSNTILMPEKEISYAVFHEMGHAMNANLSKIGSSLLKFRPLAMYAPFLVTLYSAFTSKSKPNNGNEDLTLRQKINNGIRNNAGKLSFLLMTPMLIEEGMATIKGQKFANKLLSPELAKKVRNGNCVAYLSYLTTAIFAGLGAWATTKIKDKIVEKREKKFAEEINLIYNQQKANQD